MDTLADLETLIDATRGLLAEPATWWQLGVIGAAFLLAFLTGHLLQQRLTPMVHPGVFRGIGRTAMRTGILALIPLLWWLLLLAARAWMRRRGYPVDVLQAGVYLVGALALIRAGVFVLRHSFSPGSKLKAWEWTDHHHLGLGGAAHARAAPPGRPRKPWIFDGNRFFPDTGIPILNSARKIVKLDVWLPEPLTVATVMEKLLITGVFST